MTGQPNILIIEARFYEDLADALVSGAESALKDGGARFERLSVPGAFEIPSAINMAQQSRNNDGTPRYDGYVVLGVVIRGETTHYDVVCNETSRAVQDLACRHTLPLGFGLLTVENRAQAWERADVERLNKGGEAARVCLHMLALKRDFGLA